MHTSCPSVESATDTSHLSQVVSVLFLLAQFHIATVGVVTIMNESVHLHDCIMAEDTDVHPHIFFTYPCILFQCKQPTVLHALQDRSFLLIWTLCLKSGQLQKWSRQAHFPIQKMLYQQSYWSATLESLLVDVVRVGVV